MSSQQQLSKVLREMPEDVKAVTMAMSLLITRINELPEHDKQDLFELFRELPKVDPEERQNVFSAMEEILTRKSSKPIPVDLLATKCNETLLWPQHVAKLIKKFRGEKGWTQAQLAEEADLPQSHISRLENAEHSPSHKTLSKLATALGKKVRDFDPSLD